MNNDNLIEQLLEEKAYMQEERASLLKQLDEVDKTLEDIEAELTLAFTPKQPLTDKTPNIISRLLRCLR